MNYTVTRAEIEEIAADNDGQIAAVEIGSRNGRPWHVGLTQDHTEPDSPWVAYLEELGRGGYAETFPVEVAE